jgi:hypothetical protein
MFEGLAEGIIPVWKDLADVQVFDRNSSDR